MQLTAINDLVGGYARAKIYGESGLETVRILASPVESPPGFPRQRIRARRFLSGGYLDIFLEPRDIKSPASPSEATRRIIAIIEKEPYIK